MALSKDIKSWIVSCEFMPRASHLLRSDSYADKWRCSHESIKRHCQCICNRIIQVSFLSSRFTLCSSLFNLEERITNEHQRYIEHDNCVCLSSLTEHATEHKAAAAEHLDEFTTATEQMQFMSISATTLAATLSNASKNAPLVRSCLLYTSDAADE